jgi:RNA polymerase sigma-70 factor (ECF subfamily)
MEVKSRIDPRFRAEAPAIPMVRCFAAASDAELAHALCRRQNAALDEAFRRHAPLVARTVRRTARAYYVDDIVQIVFLTLWRAPERFRPERGSLAAYLVMLARGKTIDAVRSDEHRHDRENGLQPGSGDDVEDVAIAGLAAAQLQAALRVLPTTERVAIELAFFGGDTYRAVAAKLGDSEGTTKSRIRAGLRRLEAALEGIGAAELD